MKVCPHRLIGVVGQEIMEFRQVFCIGEKCHGLVLSQDIPGFAGVDVFWHSCSFCFGDHEVDHGYCPVDRGRSLEHVDFRVEDAQSMFISLSMWIGVFLSRPRRGVRREETKVNSVQDSCRVAGKDPAHMLGRSVDDVPDRLPTRSQVVQGLGDDKGR